MNTKTRTDSLQDYAKFLQSLPTSVARCWVQVYLDTNDPLLASEAAEMFMDAEDEA